jgi:hypothetical protein
VSKLKINSTKNKKTLEVFHFSGAGGCRVNLGFDVLEPFLEAVSFFIVHFVAVVIHSCHVRVCVGVCADKHTHTHTHGYATH